MELQQLKIQQPLNNRILNILVDLNPCLAENETLLLSYYKRVRATWSNSAIKSVQKATGLKLTNKLNRCQFAIEAAKLQLQLMQSEHDEDDYSVQEELPGLGFSVSSVELDIPLPPLPDRPYSHEEKEERQLQIAQEQIKQLESQLQAREAKLESKQQQLEQAKKFSVLLLTNRLLAPGLPLNGTEESPAMRILGSPKTLTELEANYRELIKREHPDVSPFPAEEAINRFAYVRSLYRITREHWQSLKPTATISQQMLENRMKAPVPFVPESFWAA